MSAIFDAGVDLFFGLTLQCIGEDLHFLVLRCRDTRQRMIIQTRFANRNYARTLRQFAQRRYDVVPRFPDIRWMNPDDREDIRISLRDLDRAPAARDGCSDGEDAGDTSFSRSEEHTSELQSHLNLVCRLLL